MNPVIIQRKNLQKKLWEDLRPRNEEQVQAEVTYQRYGFYDESGFNLPIEADTTPALYNLCQSVKERLKVQDKVVFQIDNRAMSMAVVLCPATTVIRVLYTFRLEQ